MANEAQLHLSLRIANVDESALEYQNAPSSFNADVGSGAMGSTPGLLSATIAGVDVDLDAITTPGGFCFIQNLDPDNDVEVGIWDPEGGKFYPLMDILATEGYPIRLARNLEEEFGTGTGTTGADTNTLRIRGLTATCSVKVEAFDK